MESQRNRYPPPMPLLEQGVYNLFSGNDLPLKTPAKFADETNRTNV